MKGEKEDDGDCQLDLEVEDPYKKLVNTDNTNQVNGMLVIEIIPKDQNDPDIAIPKIGDKIAVYGAWVTDRSHGWNGIHPAWKITILK